MHTQRMPSVSLAILTYEELVHNVRLTYAELTRSVLGLRDKTSSARCIIYATFCFFGAVTRILTCESSLSAR